MGSKWLFCEARLCTEWQVLESSRLPCPGVECGAGAQSSRQARLLEEPCPGRQRSFLARPLGFLRPLGHAGGQGFS